MNSKFLKQELDNAGKEHRMISKAIIQKNINTIKRKYGTLNNAQKRLQEIEYFLNYKEWK